MTFTRHTDANEVIESLENAMDNHPKHPDVYLDPDTLGKDDWLHRCQARLGFIGEAWIDGEAREVDNGKLCFEVPMEDLYIPTSESWKIDSIASGHHVTDSLHRHENAPEKVQNWQGPFTIFVYGYGLK